MKLIKDNHHEVDLCIEKIATVLADLDVDDKSVVTALLIMLVEMAHDSPEPWQNAHFITLNFLNFFENFRKSTK